MQCNVLQCNALRLVMMQCDVFACLVVSHTATATQAGSPLSHGSEWQWNLSRKRTQERIILDL
jgi:hypothetical protein